MVSLSETTHISPFSKITGFLGKNLFGNGWGFLVPYLLIYVIFYYLDISISTLRTFFFSFHILNISLFITYLYTCRKYLKLSEIIFWAALILLFFLPGAYTEFPSDAWEHLRRIYQWDVLKFLQEGIASEKFSYFWAWTLLGNVQPIHRNIALDIYSTFWQILLAFQFYLFFRKLGFSQPWAKVQVFATILLFGTNLFSFYRYYALASTIPAYIVYLAAIVIILDIVDRNDKDTEKNKSYIPYLFKKLILLSILLIIMFFNHVQEIILLAITSLSIVTLVLLTKSKIRKFTIIALGLIIILSFLFGFLIVQYPEIIPTSRWKPDSPYISKLGTFRIWDPSLTYFETFGVHGLVSVVFAVILFKKHTQLAVVTLFPYLVLLFPPFVLLFSVSHGQATDWITYRALFALPTSVMIVQGSKDIFDFLSSKHLFPTGMKWQIAAVALIVVMLAISPTFPWRGKLWFLLHKPSTNLTLNDLQETAQWFANQPTSNFECLLFADNVTAFALPAYLGQPPTGVRLVAYNITRSVNTPEKLKTFLQWQNKCGLLLAHSSEFSDIPDSVVGKLSKHWPPSLVRDNFLLTEDAGDLPAKLVENSWNRTFIPPFYGLYFPNENPKLLSSIEYFTGLDFTHMKGAEMMAISPRRRARPITTYQPIMQTFQATKDNLAGIGLMVTTYARQNSGPIYFYLQRAENIGTTNYLGSIVIEASEIQNNQWLVIGFPPLASTNQDYAIIIESATTDPNNAIAILMDPANPYEKGQLFQAGQPETGDMIFGLWYNDP